MADYTAIKNLITDVVKTNGAQEITGANLQNVLVSMINAVNSANLSDLDRINQYLIGLSQRIDTEADAVAEELQGFSDRLDANRFGYNATVFGLITGEHTLQSAISNVPTNERFGGQKVTFYTGAGWVTYQNTSLSAANYENVNNWVLDSGVTVEGDVTITNNPDYEDLTQNNQNELKFADKEYSAATFSGLGRVYLRKNIVSNKNVLTQEMLADANTIYIIQYDYDLNEANITIPNNCILKFDGGSIGNGTLNLNGCTIIESPNALLCDCVGSITNAYLYSTTFGEAGKYNDNNTLQRALDLMLSYNYKLLLRGTYNTTDTLNYVEHTVEKAGINIEGSDVQQDGIVYSGNDAALRISQSYVAGASNFKFFQGGKIANISITNTSASASVIEISSWWQGGIDNVTIKGNGVTRYGIYTPSVDAVKSPFSNPDPYATASLELQRVRIFNCTDYGIYNANPNGDPYWSLKYCQIENNGSGIQLNSSGWSIEEGSLSYNDNYSIIFGDLEILGNQPNEFYGKGIEFDGSGNAAILFNACSNAIFELCRFIYRKIGDKLCQRNVSEIAGVSRVVINNVFRYCLFTSDGNAPAVDSIYIFNILTNNLNNNIAYNQVEGGNIRATTYNPESVFKLSNVITFYKFNSIDYRKKKQSEDKFYWVFKPRQVVLNEFNTSTTVQLIQQTNNNYVSYFDANNNILTIPSTGFYKVHMYIDFTTNSENTRLQVNAYRNSAVIINNYTNIIKSEEYTLTSKLLHTNAFACLLLNEGDTLSFASTIQAIGAAAMNDGITIRQDFSYIMVEKVV